MIDLSGASLTGLDVAEDGSVVRLGLSTNEGNSIALMLSPECLSQLLMTLPRAISTVLQKQHGDSALRLVFPLSDWRLETSHGEVLILTLVTAGGFEVAFGVRSDDLASMLVTAQSRVEAKASPATTIN